MSNPEPSRGEVWDVNFDSTTGHRQARTRPALILPEHLFTDRPPQIVMRTPITRTQGKIRWHVSVAPPEGGLSAKSFIQCENVRTVSKQSLKRRRGRVSPPVMQQVEDRLRILLGL